MQTPLPRVRLEGPRIIARSATEADVARLLDYHTRNREHLAPWEPPHDDDFYTEEYWRERCELYDNERAAGTSDRLCIFEKPDEDFLAGVLSLMTITSRAPLWNARIGYSIDRDKQNRGLMGETVALAVRHAFEAMNLKRLVAGYVPHNAPSARVLERAGFIKEGYYREYLFVGGKWHDHVDTSLINPAWRLPHAP